MEHPIVLKRIISSTQLHSQGDKLIFKTKGSQNFGHYIPDCIILYFKKVINVCVGYSWHFLLTCSKIRVSHILKVLVACMHVKIDATSAFIHSYVVGV